MIIFELSGLSGSFLLTALVVYGAVSVVTQRGLGPARRLFAAALKVWIVALCIELFLVTFSLIPPMPQATAEEQSMGLPTAIPATDWAIARGVSSLDWMLPLFGIVLGYGVFIVVRGGPKVQTPGKGSNHFEEPILASILTCFCFLRVLIPAAVADNSFIAEKFVFRGPIPLITTFLFLWLTTRLAVVAVTVMRHRRQDESVRKKWRRSTRDTSPDESDGLLASRLRELDRLRRRFASSSAADWVVVLDSSVAQEQDRLRTSLIFAHAMMWSIPVLGFVGTVWGIGDAVGGLLPLLQGLSGEEFGAEALSVPLQGLGVAFDTTLLALGLSLIAAALLAMVEFGAQQGILERDRLTREWFWKRAEPTLT